MKISKVKRPVSIIKPSVDIPTGMNDDTERLSSIIEELEGGVKSIEALQCVSLVQPFTCNSINNYDTIGSSSCLPKLTRSNDWKSTEPHL